MFFLNKGPFDINFIISKTQYTKKKKYKKFNVKNVSTIEHSKKGDITFFENKKYLNYLQKTNTSYCLIRKKDLVYLNQKKIIPIVSDKPLLDFIIIALLFYPESNQDNDDIRFSNKYNKFIDKNSFVDESVCFGKNFEIGYNSIVKKNVQIGDNVKIGSNCTISNSIISNNVIISDGSIIGKIGFGFKQINKEIIFIPHFGCVKIKENVYIGANCIIDRGSFLNTVIGKGVKIDNQVHVAHNVVVGDNTYIAAQVGIAGSSKIGKNCLIGGQTGISGHLLIGDNVKIGGKSGVIKNLTNNSKVIGYPASSFKEFLKNYD